MSRCSRDIFKFNLYCLAGNIFLFIIFIAGFLFVGYALIHKFGNDGVIFSFFTTLIPIRFLFLLRTAYKKLYPLE